MTLVRWLYLSAVVFLFAMPAHSGEPPSPELRALADRAAKAEDTFWALSDQQKTLSPEIAELNTQITEIDSSLAETQALLDGLRSGATVEPADPAKRDAVIHALAETLSRMWGARERVLHERGRIRNQELQAIPLEAARAELEKARELLARAIAAEKPRRTQTLRLSGGGEGRVLLDARWQVQAAWRAAADDVDKDRNALAEMRAKANVLQRQNLAWAQEFYDADQAWQKVLAKAIEQGVTLARIKILTQAIADSIDVFATACSLGGSAVARGTYIALDAFLKGAANYNSGRQKLAEIRDLANDRIGNTVVRLVKDHLQRRFDEPFAIDNIENVSRGPDSSFGRIMGPLGNGESSDWTTVPTAAKWLTFQLSDAHAGGDRSTYGQFEGDYWRQRELNSKMLEGITLGIDLVTTFIPLGVDMLDASLADAVAERLVRLELKRFMAWQSYNMGRDELKKTAEAARRMVSKLTEEEQKLDAAFELRLADGKTIAQDQVIEVFLTSPDEAVGVGTLSVGLSEGHGQVRANVYWLRKTGRQLIGSGRSTAAAGGISVAVFLPQPETVSEAWPVDLVIEIERGDAASAFDAGASTAAFLSLRPPDWKGYEKGKDIYKARLSVTDPLLGYWKRMGPFQIVTGRGEILDWPRGPVGFAVVDTPAKDRKASFLGLSHADTIASSSAMPGLKCSKLERAVECRLEITAGCASQWMEYRISLQDDGNGIFEVLAGELSFRADTGCSKMRHPYLTGQKIALERQLPMSEMEKRYPCPETFRCH